MAAAGGTGVFLANVIGVTSALAYFSTASAGLRLRPRSRHDDFEGGCDLWLHSCAASSSDGTFTRAKEKMCSMAASEKCMQHFDSKEISPALQRYQKGKIGLSLTSSGSTTENAVINSSMSATNKLQRSSRPLESPTWAFVACNTLVWTSVYIMCFATKKARARRSRQARSMRANDASGGERSMAVASATGIAGTAFDGGVRNDRVGVSSVGTAPRAEAAQQAPMASGFLQWASLSPGLASPPCIRRAKPAGGTPAARSSLSSPSSSRLLSGSEDAMIQYAYMESAKGSEGLSRRARPRQTKSGAPAPSSFPPLSCSAPSVFTPTETKASGEEDTKEVRASEGPNRNDTATLYLGMRFLDAQRELPSMICGGPRNGSSSAISSFANPEASFTLSSLSVSDLTASESLATDGPGSQRRSPTASVSDVPSSDIEAAHATFLDTPFTPSINYSACWNVLDEDHAQSTSPHGVPDLEIDVAMSTGSGAGSGGTVSQDTDSLNGDTPDGEMSTHDVLEPRTGESKESKVGQRTSWLTPPTESPVGVNVRRPIVDAIQFAGFDATPSSLSCPRGGVEVAKEPLTNETSRSGSIQELGPDACSDAIGECVAEARGESFLEGLSVAMEPELVAHARSDVIEGSVAESGGSRNRLPQSSECEIQEFARLNEILDEALLVLDSDE